MNVLCSDKTGTLTMNQLSVTQPAFVTDEHRAGEDEMLFVGACAAKRGGEEQDAIDGCLCNEVARRGLKETLDMYHTLHFIPFDPVTKRTEAVVEYQGPAGQENGPKLPTRKRNI